MAKCPEETSPYRPSLQGSQVLILSHCSPAYNCLTSPNTQASISTRDSPFRPTMLERKENERLVSCEHKTYTHLSDQGEGVKRASGDTKSSRLTCSLRNPISNTEPEIWWVPRLGKSYFNLVFLNFLFFHYCPSRNFSDIFFLNASNDILIPQQYRKYVYILDDYLCMLHTWKS